MQNISLQVAFCKCCNGYRASTTKFSSHHNHADIISYYICHESPWFTFDDSLFSEISSVNDVTVREVKLSVQKENDKNYYQCPAFSTENKLSGLSIEAEYHKEESLLFEHSETEYYFRDIYQISSMFH